MSEKRLYSILAIIFWVLGSFGIWEVVYELSHMVGAIVSGDPGYALGELLRMLPLILLVAIFIFSGMFLHNAFIAENEKVRKRNWKAMGTFIIVMSSLIILYVPVGRLTGRYYRLVEGYPTALFPLDTVILGLALIVFGYWAVKRKPLGEFPYGICHFNGLLRGIGRFFCMLSYFVSTAAFAGFVYGLFIMDWSHGYLFYNFMLLLVFGLAFGYFAVYRFIYCRWPNEKKNAGLIKMSIISLVVAIVVMVLYLTAEQLYPMAPNQNAFALHPVDFTASVGVLPLLYGANNLLVPICALLYGLITRKNRSV